MVFKLILWLSILELALCLPDPDSDNINTNLQEVVFGEGIEASAEKLQINENEKFPPIIIKGSNKGNGEKGNEMAFKKKPIKCKTKKICSDAGGECQDIKEECNGEMIEGKKYCSRFSTCGCCIPKITGCRLDDTVYRDESLVEDRCIYMQCIDGAWKYAGFNNDCNFCNYYIRNSAMNMREHHDIDGRTFKQYHVNEIGTYVFSQIGLPKPAEVVMESKIEYFDEFNTATINTVFTYKELELEIELIFPSPNDFAFCDSSPTDPYCEAQIFVNDHKITLDSAYGSVTPIYGLTGTVFIINRGWTWPWTYARGNFLIVGSQKTSVLVNYNYWYAYGAVFMAMPDLMNNTYGLCDVWTGGVPTAYTMSNGIQTTHTDDFVDSWKVGINYDGPESEETSKSQSGKACTFGFTQYPDNSILEDVCLQMKCVNGKWIYDSIINTNCAECSVYGEPHIILYDQSAPDGDNSAIRTSTGNYAISQAGFDEDPLFGVNSTFGPCAGQWSCISSVTYKEPGINVLMILNDPNDITHCTEPSNCIITVWVNDVKRTITSAVSQYRGGEGDVLIFSHNHIDVLQNVNCINIIGSKGFSVSLCQHQGDYAFLYVWVMKDIQDAIYGLCDTLDGFGDGEYTTRDDTRTPDYDVSLKSWEIEKKSAKSLITSTPETRCANTTVERQIQDQCNKTMKLCPIHTGPFYESCVFDLCRVDNPDRYLAGYASHVLVHKQVSVSAPKCSCSWRRIIDTPITEGCYITKAAPNPFTACHCALIEEIPEFCIGIVVYYCKNESSKYCAFPGTGKPSCEQGQGNCGGYPFWT